MSQWKYSVMCCGNCAHWPTNQDQSDRQPYGLGGPSGDGTVSDCRKRAPILLRTDRHPSATAEWPTTRRDDFCDEFELR